MHFYLILFILTLNLHLIYGADKLFEQDRFYILGLKYKSLLFDITDKKSLIKLNDIQPSFSIENIYYPKSHLYFFCRIEDKLSKKFNTGINIGLDPIIK